MRLRLALVACAAVLAVAAPARAEDPVAGTTGPTGPLEDPGQIMLDEGGIKVGLVKLTLPGGCRRQPFRATVTGNGITRVDFRVDGRVVRSVRAPDDAGRFTVRVDPRRVRRGAHRLVGDIFFGHARTSPDKQVRGTFRSCVRR